MSPENRGGQRRIVARVRVHVYTSVVKVSSVLEEWLINFVYLVSDRRIGPSASLLRVLFD